MCGRYASFEPPEAIARMFRTAGAVPNVAPSWNVAPGQSAMVVRRHAQSGERRLDLLAWGLLPHWTKDPASARRPINARAETVASLPSFREAFRQRRALVPAQAFYEWRREQGGGKQPLAIAPHAGGTLALAGLWEGWRGPQGEVVRSFAVIVTAANATMAPIHERMPVIIAPADWALWLGEVEGDVVALLRPPADDLLRVWPVDRRVNRQAENDAGLLAPLGGG